MNRYRTLCLIWCLSTLVLSTLPAQTSRGVQPEVPVGVVKFIEGLNQHSYPVAQAWIAADFKIKGVAPQDMPMTLTQLFSSYSGQIDSCIYINSRRVRGGNVQLVRITKDGIAKDVEFGMDKRGKIRSCTLFYSLVMSDNETPGPNLLLNKYAEIDFELQNGIIVIPVMIEGVEQKFLLDSGAPVFALNTETSRRKSDSVVMGSGIGGAISNMGTMQVGKMSWAGGANQDFEALTIDMAHLESEVGVKFGGLISKAEMEPFEVYFDYARQKMRLYLLNEAGEFVEPQRFVTPKQEMAFEQKRHIAVIPAKVSGKSVKMGLDTGAQANLLDDKYYPKLQKFLQGAASDTIRGADINASAVHTGRIATTRVSNLKFPDMIYAFSDIDPLNKAYGLAIDGILGYPFMSQRVFSINYRKQVIRFY